MALNQVLIRYQSKDILFIIYHSLNNCLIPKLLKHEFLHPFFPISNNK